MLNFETEDSNLLLSKYTCQSVNIKTVHVRVCVCVRAHTCVCVLILCLFFFF